MTSPDRALAGYDPALITEQVKNVLLKDVAPSSRRIYETDARQFLAWLDTRGAALATVDYAALVDYKDGLLQTRSKVTAARKIVVARRLLDVAVLLGHRPDNPARRLSAIKGAAQQETTHRALNKQEAQGLLAVIDRTSIKGKRDYALIMLLLRTGLRRAEAASLVLGDLGQEQGHSIATVRHGKGDKRRIIKLPVDVLRTINEYLDGAGRKGAGPTAPLFASLGQYGRATTDRPLKGLDIERVVEGYAKQAGLDGLSPHGLRASFVTLALENGAKLQQVQYAAGHADPRTTERYQKRKLNLDDNATDYLRF